MEFKELPGKCGFTLFEIVNSRSGTYSLDKTGTGGVAAQVLVEYTTHTPI